MRINTDKVPAMLTEGEGVVNRYAMQLPGVKNFVKDKNKAGNNIGRKVETNMIKKYQSGTSGAAIGPVDDTTQDPSKNYNPSQYPWKNPMYRIDPYNTNPIKRPLPPTIQSQSPPNPGPGTQPPFNWFPPGLPPIGQTDGSDPNAPHIGGAMPPPPIQSIDDNPAGQIAAASLVPSPYGPQAPPGSGNLWGSGGQPTDSGGGNPTPSVPTYLGPPQPLQRGAGMVWTGPGDYSSGAMSPELMQQKFGGSPAGQLNTPVGPTPPPAPIQLLYRGGMVRMPIILHNGAVKRYQSGTTGAAIGPVGDEVPQDGSGKPGTDWTKQNQNVFNSPTGTVNGMMIPQVQTNPSMSGQLSAAGNAVTPGNMDYSTLSGFHQLQTDPSVANTTQANNTSVHPWIQNALARGFGFGQRI
jgi:hypothetical protein